MGCGMSLVKYVLFIFNLLCALCGIGLITVGAGFLLKYEEILDAFKEAKVNVAPISLIAIGTIILVIAFFGCCGAIRESHCMVSTYATFLFLLLVIQIVFSVLVFTNKEGIQRVTDRLLQNLWKDRDHHQRFWDTMQSSLQCCGLNSPVDYNYLSFVPQSCCAPHTDVCTYLVNAFPTGCSSALRSAIGSASSVFGITGLTVSAILLAGFIFSCCLMNNIRNRERRYA